MVYIVLRNTSLFQEKLIVRLVDSVPDEIIDSLDDPAGTWLREGDEVYEAKLVFKIVSKPKVIKTSELKLEVVE